jgi:hypothetical protein
LPIIDTINIERAKSFQSFFHGQNTDFTLTPLTLKQPLAVHGSDSLRGAQIWLFINAPFTFLYSIGHILPTS